MTQNSKLGWTLLREDGEDSVLGWSLGWFAEDGATPIVAGRPDDAFHARLYSVVGSPSEYIVASAFRSPNGDIMTDVPGHGAITFLAPDYDSYE